ncbi:MAG: AAA family ATPase [Melioribacteraceae bacterium]|nr:AAA family ATPase [Melioribacteraceae bacterium]
MYWEYFNLNENPFGLTPDPKFLYLSKPHTTCIEWMKFAIEQHEFGLITGEVGSGKTVLSRYIIDSLEDEKYKVCWIINPSMSAVQLLKEIYRQLFEEEPPFRKAQLIKKLEEGLTKFFLDDIYPVIFIDESQSIPSPKVFEELRLLSNYQTDSQLLLSIVLLAQPEILKRLKRETYRAFTQRVRYTISLEALNENEVKEYIKHRLNITGAKGDLFDEEAYKELHRLTKGYPRPLNHLASFSLLETMVAQNNIVTAEVVRKAAKSIIYINENENLSGALE